MFFFALHYFALLCFALHCYALLCFILLCFAFLCIALLCFALLCFAMHRKPNRGTLSKREEFLADSQRNQGAPAAETSHRGTHPVKLPWGFPGACPSNPESNLKEPGGKCVNGCRMAPSHVLHTGMKEHA